MAYSVTALKRAKPRYAAVINMTITRTFLAVLLMAMLLSACGQRGPLYLPDDNTQTPAQTGQPADAEENSLEAELDDEDKQVDGL